MSTEEIRSTTVKLDPVPDPASLQERPGLGDSGRMQFLQESGMVGQDVIEIAALDKERDTRSEEILAKAKATSRETFYSDLIYTLTHLRYDEPEARVLWVNLLAHKIEMSDRMGRNVGIRVAALDYFHNILGVLDDAKIIDADKYIETAQLAITDGLTGVFNHRYFQDRLERDVARASETEQPLSLLMLDIDYFKQYNDINGHIAGDVALKEVASVLRRNLKKADLIARYGGEEFAAILFGVGRGEAEVVAERLRATIAQLPFPNEKVLPGGQLTISVGLAQLGLDADDRNGLIMAADQALYLAKRSGRNRICAAPPDFRRSNRQAVELDVKFRLLPGKGVPDPAPVFAAKAVNLSRSGICISTQGGLRVNQGVEVAIAGDGAQVVLEGQVVWEISQASYQEVGIRFHHVSKENQVTLGQLMRSRHPR